MRLLLFLSALLTALSGVAGPRAMAQPVEASAGTPITSEQAVAVVPPAIRFVAAAYDAAPPRRLAAPPVRRLAAAPTGYRERRRE